MAVSTDSTGLPYGIGRIGRGSAAVILVLLLILALGAYAYSRQVIQGEIVTGLRDVGTMGGAPWGLYIAFELYAVGIGFGAMMLVGIIRLFGLDHLRPLARTLGLMTLTTLVAGYLAVVADLGQPLRAIINVARYARPMSPFFGTFTVGLITSLVATWVYLYLDSRQDAAVLARRPGPWRGWLSFVAAGYRGTPEEERRHQRTSLVLAAVVLMVGIGAASTSGFVFSVQSGRPGWFSALQAPAFVALAAATGAGALIVIAAVLRAGLGELERLNLRVFSWLSNLMTGLTLLYLYFLLAELVTIGYAGQTHEARVSDALLRGEYAWLFWLSGGLFLVSFLIGAGQALWRRYSMTLIVLAALLLNLAAIGKRYLVVVPSLTYGNLLPYPVGSYFPTWVEYAVVVGLISLSALLYILFMKVFPIMEVRETS